MFGTTGGGLFGSTSTSTPGTSGGGLFGGAASTTSGGGLFGGNPAATTTGGGGGGGGGFFGSSTPNTASSGLFGSSTPQQQQQSNPFGGTQQTSSLFGTPSGTSGGGLFGSSNTSGGGLFGGAASNTGSGGGLFGNAATPNTGGNLFGNTATPNTGGGLFGNTNVATGGGGGGLFGGSANTGGGLFGSSSTNTGGGGLFGNVNTNTGGGGLFGGTNSSGGGLFGGAPSTGGGFLGPNANTMTTGGGLFGGTSTSGGLFGSNFNTTSNNNSFPFQQQQQTLAQAANAPWWYRELLSIQAAYRPGPGCKFQAMVYEVVGVAPDLLFVSGAVAPAHIDYVKAQRKRQILQQLPWIDHRDWQHAEERNPDPSNWMPTPIIGIDALYKRVGEQSAHIRNQLAMLKQNQDANSEENVNAWLELDPGSMFEDLIEQCRHEQIRLTRRLIKVMGRLERLQCAGIRGGRTQAEIEFNERLEVLQKILDDPKGCKAQLSHLAARLQMESINFNFSHSSSQVNSNSLNGSNIDVLGLRPNEEEAIFNFLDFQRDGLEHLMKIVKKDMRDLEIIKHRIAPHIR